jgi:hypothetical protein
MLFVPRAGGFGGDVAASLTSGQLREERCLRHRVQRRTRHPLLGAAGRRAALLVNLLK